MFVKPFFGQTEIRLSSQILEYPCIGVLSDLGILTWSRSRVRWDCGLGMDGQKKKGGGE